VTAKGRSEITLRNPSHRSVFYSLGEEARVHNPRVYGLAWWMWRDEWEREGEVAARVWWG